MFSDSKLIVELFMFFIWNTLFLIQNVIKRSRVGPKNRVGRVTGNKQLFLRSDIYMKSNLLYYQY